jgi:WS/DGAT/MGAT family acyltransferase
VTTRQQSVSPDAAALAAWSAGHELSDTEALMWRAEAEARLRSDVLLLNILDRAPDWDRLVAVHATHVGAVPRFRQRVVDDPLRLARPRWQQTDVDLAYHLTRCQLPAGSGEEGLLDLAATLHMAPFDPARPLWQAMLVEGLPDGKAGYLLKLHHAITDGASGVALFNMLLPAGPEESDEPVLPTISAATPLREPVDSVRAVTDLVVEGGRVAVAALRHPNSALAYLRSLRRVLAVPGTPSPLLSRRGLARRLRVLDFPLTDLRTAAKATGASLNDVYLAGLLGGLGHYHAKHGAPVGDVPIAIPVSTRKADEAAGGNKFAGAYVAAPVGEPDPLRRITLIGERVRAARSEPALDFLAASAPLSSRLPIGVLGPMTLGIAEKTALQASNIPGLNRPAYLAGAHIERMFPFGPVPGCAIMAVMLTHAGTCCLTFTTDHDAVPDPDLLLDCMRQGFGEIIALGR